MNAAREAWEWLGGNGYRGGGDDGGKKGMGIGMGGGGGVDWSGSGGNGNGMMDDTKGGDA